MFSMRARRSADSRVRGWLWLRLVACHLSFTAQGPEHSGTIAQNFDDDAAAEVTPELVLHMGGHTVAHGVAFGGQGQVGPEMLLDDAVEALCLQAAGLVRRGAWAQPRRGACTIIVAPPSCRQVQPFGMVC